MKNHYVYQSKTIEMLLRALLIQIAFAVLSLVDPSYCHGQSDYRQGFLIRAIGDTTRGFIDYRGDDNYEKCNFRETLSSEVKSYEPTEIIAYGFSGDRLYESRQITIDNQKLFVFLEVVIKSRVSLFKYKSHFLVGKEGEPHELKNQSSEMIVNGVVKKRSTNSHIGILAFLMSDCPDIKNDVQNTLVSEKSLTKLITKYNTCVGQKSVSYKENVPWFKATIGVTAGFVFGSTMKVRTDHPDYVEIVGKYKNDKPFVFGIDLELNSPRLNERLFFSMGGFYQSSTFTVSTVDGSAAIQRNHVSVDLTQVKVPIGFRYKFRGNHLAPFVNAGTVAVFNLKTSSNWVEEIEYPDGSTVSNEYQLPPFKKKNLGFWGGVGLRKQIGQSLSGTIEARYELTRGPMHTTLPSAVRSFQILVGLRFL